MKKKKLKLKTKYKFLLIIIAIFLVTFFSMNFLFNIILIGDKDIYLNVNSSYFENGYKATFFGKKLKVDVKNNIDNTSLGDYKVTYTANLLNFKKSVIRNIHVVDNEKPVITLNGDITNEKLGLDDNVYEKLTHDVSIVIHSAANVSYFCS